MVVVVVDAAAAAAAAWLLRNKSAHDDGFDFTDDDRLSDDGFNVSIEAPLATDVEYIDRSLLFNNVLLIDICSGWSISLSVSVVVSRPKKRLINLNWIKRIN